MIFHLVTIILWILAIVGVEPLASAPWYLLSLPSLIIVGLAMVMWTVAGTIFVLATRK